MLCTPGRLPRRFALKVRPKGSGDRGSSCGVRLVAFLRHLRASSARKHRLMAVLCVPLWSAPIVRLIHGGALHARAVAETVRAQSAPKGLGRSWQLVWRAAGRVFEALACVLGSQTSPHGSAVRPVVVCADRAVDPRRCSARPGGCRDGSRSKCAQKARAIVAARVACGWSRF